MTDGWMDATALAGLVRTGAATPLELVDDAIARIERVNPQLNAVIHERFARARDDARGALADGPFRGVPFLVKDAVCHEAGEPYHFGMQVLKDLGWRAETDTWLRPAPARSRAVRRVTRRIRGGRRGTANADQTTSSPRPTPRPTSTPISGLR